MKNIKCISLFFILLLNTVASYAENFPRPTELEHDVQFWVRVYTEIDTRSGFIHDSNNLSIVYESVRVNGGTRSNKRKIKKTKERYKAILKKLSTGKRSNLSEEEKRVLNLWGNHVSNARLKEAANKIRFQRGQSNRFREGIRRSGEWRTYINKTFRDLDMPVELAVLPHVESSFNPKAYSHVGAAGIWQFIRSTGRRYMQIDYLIDERMDPFASTVAAAKLLRHNYSITKSWPLALTAYNHGVASMRRAINKLGTRDIEIIVRKYKGRAFGFASRNFYVAFLAALDVDRNSIKYFGDVKKERPFQYDTVKMSDYLFAKDVAQYLQISKMDLKRHNRSLLASIWNDSKRIPKGFVLRVPKSLIKKSAKTLLAEIPVEHRYSEQTPDLFHHVVRGDTISEIAAQYGFKVREVMNANGMSKGNYIRVGQKLRLPVKDGVGVVTIASAKDVIEKNQTTKEEVIETKSEHKDPIGSLSNNTETNTIVNEQIVEPDVVDDSESDVSVVAEPIQEVASNASLLSDPADYTVAQDSSIEVQASETLGHYAEWLDLRASRLRDINGLRFGKSVVVGHRLKLDFSRVTTEEFERRRVAFQKNLQEEFFTQYRIESTYQHTIKRGESLWVLALRKFKVPIWLLRQHNPDVNFDQMRPGVVITVPNLLEVSRTQIP